MNSQLLRKFDIFGIRIGLRYKQNELHQSNFGATITICLVGLTMVQVYLVAQKLILKQNPEVISSERYVASPQRYNMNKENFNIAYGVQNGLNHQQLIDPTIYNVKAEQIIMKKVFNNKTNEYVQDFVFTPLDQFPCTQDSFQEPETQNIFQSLPNVETMYCVKQNNPEVYMEGDFTSDNFALFQLTFSICDQSTNPLCKDPQTVQKALVGSYVALYLNDIIINPKNEYPFEKVEKDLFWNTSPKVAKQINVYYRNVYVESDTGLLFENKYQQRDIAIGSVDEQIILRFEKQKESIYYRNYMKLDSALAQVGGIAKSLMILGFCVCVPFNRLNLHYLLACQLFKFEEEEQENSPDKPKSSPQTKNSIQQSPLEVTDSKQQKYSSTQRMKENKNKDMQQFFPISLEQNRNQKIVRNIRNEKKIQINQNQNEKKEIKKKSNKEKKGFSLNWYEYFMYYLWNWGNFKHKKQQLNNAIQHIYSHLDMLSIINKLVELDRIKSLLFDEDQIKLFQFLPKPTIGLENPLNMSTQNNSKTFLKRKKERPISNVLSENKPVYESEVDEQKNTQQAYSALQNTIKKQELTNVDSKLIEMLDDSFINQFKEHHIFQNQLEKQSFNFNFLSNKKGSRLQFTKQISCQYNKQTEDKIIEGDVRNQNLHQSSNQQKGQTSLSDKKLIPVETPKRQEHETISDSIRLSFMESSKQDLNIQIHEKYQEPITLKNQHNQVKQI